MQCVHDGIVPADGAGLYYRELGQGVPTLVLHGGPDFDHAYFLPELDVLSHALRLIYYDQRGRGRSAGKATDVTLASEVADVEAVRSFFELETVVILGHSWGALLSLAYALAYPQRVSHLILMNSAPASREDFLLLRRARLDAAGEDMARIAALQATEAYQEGDLAADAAYHRIHFGQTVRQPQLLERVVNSLRAHCTKETIVRARAIEARLLAETWLAPDFDLLPALRTLPMPALVLHGEHDLVPLICAQHAAEAIPRAHLRVLAGTGHFSFIEAPERVFDGIVGFLNTA